jgi:NUMOD3 motif
MNFYTYMWLRDDGTPYYIGKGVGNRAYENKSHIPKCPIDKSKILIQTFETEQDAFSAETFLIAYYGRKDKNTGCLRNQTDGGEGCTGYTHNATSLRKMSAVHTGKKISKKQRLEHSARMTGAGNPLFGKHRIPEGKWLLNLQTNWLGKKHSEETKKIMSVSAKKRWNDMCIVRK